MQKPVLNKRRQWLIFAVTSLGTFMATLDSSIVNVALPTVANQLQADLPLVQWVVSAYLLAISSLLPLFGRTGDMFGRKNVYTIGFLIFTIGSLLCGLAGSISLLIMARVVQAVGAAMLMANSAAIVIAAFPGFERGRALGMIGTVVALGSMAGPAIGGLLVGSFGWRTIFYINLPIGVTGYFMGRAILPPEQRKKAEPFDFAGAVLFAAGMTSFLLVFNNGREFGWLSPLILSGGAVAVLALGAFVWQEKRTSSPMIDLALFKHWPFLAGNISGLTAFMAMFSNVMLLPFYLHSVLHLTSTQIGLLMTPFPIVMAVTAPVSGYLSERLGFVILTTTGLTLMIAALLYLTTLGATASMLEVALSQALLGLGNGMFQSPNNNSVMSSVAKDKLGIAGGINSLVRNVGMVLGIAIAVSIFENRRYNALQGIDFPTPFQEMSAFLTAYHTALAVGAAFAAIGALISLNRKGYAGQQQEGKRKYE